MEFKAENAKTLDEYLLALGDFITAKYAETNASIDVAFHINNNNSNLASDGSVDENKLASFAYVYYNWAVDMKIYTPPKD